MASDKLTCTFEIKYCSLNGQSVTIQRGRTGSRGGGEREKGEGERAGREEKRESERERD